MPVEARAMSKHRLGSETGVEDGMRHYSGTDKSGSRG